MLEPKLLKNHAAERDGGMTNEPNKNFKHKYTENKNIVEKKQTATNKIDVSFELNVPIAFILVILSILMLLTFFIF